MRVCLIIIALLFIGATHKEEIVVKGNEYKLIMPELKPSKPLEKLKHVLAQRESRGDYHVVNQIGCLGKYQFTKRTLKLLGYTTKDIKPFLLCYKVNKATLKAPESYTYSTDMQEEAMDKLLKANYKWLRQARLLKYKGEVIGGIKITEEGMLAACHLLGGEALKDYLISGGDMRQYYKEYKSKTIYIRKYDSNGTSIKEYLNLIK